jgi:DNA-binding NtrC family response regulator
MSDSVSVLILAREELISALLGLLVETTGHSVVFAKPEESSEEAMRRLGPQVVIVDCDHRDCTGDLVRAANALGARLILFSASREPDYVRKVAAPSSSQSFTFPIEPPRLDSIIRLRTA